MPDYFWRELACRLLGHRVCKDNNGDRYCSRCWDTIVGEGKYR